MIHLLVLHKLLEKEKLEKFHKQTQAIHLVIVGTTPNQRSRLLRTHVLQLEGASLTVESILKNWSKWETSELTMYGSRIKIAHSTLTGYKPAVRAFLSELEFCAQNRHQRQSNNDPNNNNNNTVSSLLDHEPSQWKY